MSANETPNETPVPQPPAPETPASPASTDETPEVVEVPVKKFEVNITLDDLLTRMSEQAGRVAQARIAAAGQGEVAARAAAAQPEGGQPSDATQHLQRLSELAAQLRETVSQINQLEPTLLSQLKQEQQPPPGQPPLT